MKLDVDELPVKCILMSSNEASVGVLAHDSLLCPS